jgi:sugar lactone lactonase YvrE
MLSRIIAFECTVRPMAERELKPLHEGGHFFEGPRWHDGRWYVSDFYAHAVYTVGEDGRAEEVMRVEQQPSGLGWLPDGSLIVVSMRDRKLLRRAPDGSVSVHADVSEHCGGHLNDVVVDAAGRAYVGNFGFDLMTGADPEYAKLVRVDPDGSVSVAADELMFPNGSVIAGDTLIVAETMGGRMSGFTIAPDGTLTDRHVWAQISPTPAMGPLGEMLAAGGFAPDGIALDSEGHVWAANAMGGPVGRIAPGGEIVDEIELPEGMGCFAVALGGSDGHTLLLCSAPDFAEHARKAAQEAVLFTTQVEAGA